MRAHPRRPRSLFSAHSHSRTGKEIPFLGWFSKRAGASSQETLVMSILFGLVERHIKGTRASMTFGENHYDQIYDHI